MDLLKFPYMLGLLLIWFSSVYVLWIGCICYIVFVSLLGPHSGGVRAHNVFVTVRITLNQSGGPEARGGLSRVPRTTS